jgi:hypothetical protein
MPDITPDPIMRIALGFMAAKHLFTASAIGLFEHLAGGPATLDELAARCGIPRRTLGISADAMASLGLIERDGERYRNSNRRRGLATSWRELRAILPDGGHRDASWHDGGGRGWAVRRPLWPR